MTTPIKPSGMAQARALLQPSATELKKASIILAKERGAKGGKSRSKAKIEAVRKNIQIARAKRWAKKK